MTVAINSNDLIGIDNDLEEAIPSASDVGGGTSDIMQGLDYGSYPNARSFTLGLNIKF